MKTHYPSILMIVPLLVLTLLLSACQPIQPPPPEPEGPQLDFPPEQIVTPERPGPKQAGFCQQPACLGPGRSDKRSR